MPLGTNSDKAWHQLELVYTHHPALMTERSNTLHAAVRRLTLRAWEGREKQYAAEGRSAQEAPPFIHTLKNYYAKRGPTWFVGSSSGEPRVGRVAFGALPFDGLQQDQQQPEIQQQPQQPTPSDGTQTGQEPSFSDFETPTDWAQWDDLINSFEWQNWDGTGMFNFDIPNPQ